MKDTTHLDGSSMGAMLFDLFGQEMTGRHGCCRNCGAVNALGALHVYRDAPGDVMRCPSCDSVLVVVVTTEAGYRVSIEALRWIEISV